MHGVRRPAAILALVAALVGVARAAQDEGVAERLARAEILRARGTGDALREAAAIFDTAATDAAAAKDPAHQAAALVGIARTRDALGDGRRGMDAFQQALLLYQRLQDRENEAWTLNYGALALDRLGDRAIALDWMARADVIARGRNDRLEAITLNNLGVVNYDLGNRAEALQYYLDALAKNRALGNQRGVATSLTNVGTTYDAIGEKAKAIEYFLEALELRQTVGDPRDRATTLNNLGVVYMTTDDTARAADYYTRALAEWRAAGDRSGEAATLHNIGGVYELAGEFQKALGFYQQAMPLHRAVGYRFGEANTLNNIGRVYATLGDRARALDFYQQALVIHRAIGNRASEASTLTNMGVVYATTGESARALELYDRALELRRAVGDRGGEASTLTDTAHVKAAAGRADDARVLLEQALTLHRAVGSRHGEARDLVELGALAVQTGDFAGALAPLDAAIDLSASVGDPGGEAFARYTRGRARAELGDITPAAADAEAAIAIAETLRRHVASPDLRTSYFASVRDYYDLAIELDMKRSQTEPDGGFDRRALEISERARARALVNLLAETTADIRADVDPVLLAKERDARRVVNARGERLARLLARPHDDQQARRINEQLADAVAALRDTEHQIRAASPAFAALTEPDPPRFDDLQRQLGPETLWLEFALGPRRSYLWVVSADHLTSFELPPRAEIIALASRVHDAVSREGHTAAFDAAARPLVDALLRPAAPLLGHRRLVIAADSVLEFVPFAALPDPAAGGAPLLAAHEIVGLPSMAALAVLRATIDQRQPAPKALAVVADPVFDPGDPRVRLPKLAGARAEDEAPVPLRPSVEGGLPRLIGSRREAAAILAFAAPASRHADFDFAASRASALNGDLASYRIVHFATHSILDTIHPELSGIVLSLVNEHGVPQDGFVRVHDLFNLRLRADLVVLSACQTALGADVRGEGVVGLARGFMYAGAARIVAARWKVDDGATAELMTRFYARMLGPAHQRPAEALRAAQLSMWRDPAWRAPYYWAAFGVLGDWR